MRRYWLIIIVIILLRHSDKSSAIFNNNINSRCSGWGVEKGGGVCGAAGEKNPFPGGGVVPKNKKDTSTITHNTVITRRRCNMVGSLTNTFVNNDAT